MLTFSLAQLLALEYNTGLPARTLNVNTVQNLDFCEFLLMFVFNDYNGPQYVLISIGLSIATTGS